MLSNYINNFLQIFGIEIHRVQTTSRQIQLGKFCWLQEKEIKTVLDIGANVGQFAEMIRQICPAAMIYSFEPLESCYQQLKFKAQHLMPMHCFQFALGSEEAILTIHRNEYTPSSSLLPMTKRHRDAFPYTRKVVEEQIAVRVLDQVILELSIQTPLLMKIDVQGYELNVLRGAEEALRLVEILIIEVSFTKLYEGQPLFDDIYCYLKERNFLYTGNLVQLIDPSNGAILQADAIFLRQNTVK